MRVPGQEVPVPPLADVTVARLLRGSSPGAPRGGLSLGNPQRGSLLLQTVRMRPGCSFITEGLDA